jgi:hypothetical protein
LLAGFAGLSLVAVGALGLRRGLVPAAGVMAPGMFIAVSGFAARVVALASTVEGLVIRYAARRPFLVPWSGCVELRPPRTPLGGWRLSTRRGSRTLMPTDVLGQERVLDALIMGSGLVFQGRSWRAPAVLALGGAVSPAA